MKALHENRQKEEEDSVRRQIEHLKRIAMLAERFKMIRKTEKIAGIHECTSMQSVNHKSINPGRFLRVSS